MVYHAYIAGLSGFSLTADEISLFKNCEPWGFILFRRNIDTPAQVRALTDSLRTLTGRKNLPVLIDQEGGRVQRMNSPHWPVYPAGSIFGRIAQKDLAQARHLARLGARLIAYDLHEVGITVDCLPVLDVPQKEAHDVIGDRAYSDQPDLIAQLGRSAAEGLMAGGVLPVIKHIPGHGRAMADSHEALPIVTATRNALIKHDLPPFEMLSDMPLAMTAHVVYTALDPSEPATTSRKVIQSIIRRRMGFGGLLMSDDLSMKALSGSFAQRTLNSLKAGCDVVLHCNGDITEMREIAAHVPPMRGKAKARAEGALARLVTKPEALDLKKARAEFNAGIEVY